MVILKNFKNIFAIEELRYKILFTLGILIINRLGAYVTAVGINAMYVGEQLKQATGFGGLLSYLDMFSGAALGNCAIFALGISPYITASIMMQLLGMSIPQLEQLLKEGEYGRRIINQYTRYLTLLLSIGYSFSYALILERTPGVVLTPGWGFRLMFVVSLTVGAMFVMWLGEQISLHGLGNGSSVIIFANIVSRFPEYAIKTYAVFSTGSIAAWHVLVMVAIVLGITACIIFFEKGERKIPVQYARRVVGHRVYGGQSSYIPFKINPANIMPIIFTGAVLQMPAMLFGALASKAEIFRKIADLFTQSSFFFNALQFALIIFFSFFYTALIFNPDELAENIKKNGGFIPSIRPGKKTAEFFHYILTRVGLVGAIYIATLALIPNIVQFFITMPFYLSGTSLLIVVGVALDVSAQIESFLIEHRYEGFLTSGRLKGRVTR